MTAYGIRYWQFDPQGGQFQTLSDGFDFPDSSIIKCFGGVDSNNHKSIHYQTRRAGTVLTLNGLLENQRDQV